MNQKQLVDAVSSETNVPAAQVRKVTLAVLKQLAGLIESQTKFTSSVVTLNPGTARAKPAREDKPAVPERKFGRLMIRNKKEKPAQEG